MNILNDLVFTYEQAGSSLFIALHNDARLIFWMLALMSTVWSLIQVAARPHSEALVNHVGRHLLFFAVFGGFFLEVFPDTVGALPRYFMDVGFQSTGSDTYFNPSDIIGAGFGLSVRMLQSTSLFALLSGTGAIVRVIGAAIMMASFIFIALKVTQILIEQYIAVLGVGVFLFAFSGSKWTWSLAEGVIRYAVHLGLRLMLLMVIFDVGKSLIGIWNEALSQPFGWLSLRDWIQLQVGPIVFAYIAWTVPERAATHLASRIQIPNPHLA